MAINRQGVSGSIFTVTFQSTLNTGNLAATAFLDPAVQGGGGTIPAGRYLVCIGFKVNTNIATSTCTAVTIDGKNMLLPTASVSLALAAGTTVGVAAVHEFSGAAATTVATTTANAPQYDITVTAVWLSAL